MGAGRVVQAQPIPGDYHKPSVAIIDNKNEGETSFVAYITDKLILKRRSGQPAAL